ncbi:MAG: cation transporter [Gammaproteobacteria bacterium]|nr:cation transporter [Gammaproteobacteria bacterium]
MSGCGCEFEIKNKEQSAVLKKLLLINAVMFVIEITLGVMAESTALIADSLDMFADAAVYSIGLYAVGRSQTAKNHAASISGVLQIILGLMVIIDVLRRYLYGSEPDSSLMIVVGMVALVANLICLKLLSRHRDGEVHMRASWIFSKNDVIANIGIILSGIIVYWSGQSLPDLIIGLVISLIVIRGGVEILRDAKQEKRLCSGE